MQPGLNSQGPCGTRRCLVIPLIAAAVAGCAVGLKEEERRNPSAPKTTLEQGEAAPGPTSEEYMRQRSSRPYPRRLTLEPGDIGFDPVGVAYSGRDSKGVVTVLSVEGLVRWANARARDAGWTGPFRGYLVLRAGKDDERCVTIAPMSLENMRAADVRVEDVDWVFLRQGP